MSIPMRITSMDTERWTLRKPHTNEDWKTDRWLSMTTKFKIVLHLLPKIRKRVSSIADKIESYGLKRAWSVMVDDPKEALRNFMNNNGDASVSLDTSYCLSLTMKNETNIIFMSSIASPLPQMKKIRINYVPIEGSGIISKFLSLAIPVRLKVLHLNYSHIKLVNKGEYINSIIKAVETVDEELAICYFDLGKEHLQDLIRSSSHIKTVILQQCKLPYSETDFDFSRNKDYEIHTLSFQACGSFHNNGKYCINWIIH